jgi:hypothetical protein
MPESWFNNGFKYIFACIDVFSKKADMIPLKDREQTTTTGLGRDPSRARAAGSIT